MPDLEFYLRVCRQHDKTHTPFCRVFVSGARRDRTDDLLRAKQALSQLSYGPRTAEFTAGRR
jgi:hypothetical protein